MVDEGIFSKPSGQTDVGDDVAAFEQGATRKEEVDHYASMFARAIESTKLADVVELNTAEVGQIHILARVKRHNEKLWIDKIVDAILLVCEKDNIDQHICKQFFRRHGKKKFGWMISYGATDIKTATISICSSIEELVPKHEVLEAPLIGRGTPQSGGQVGPKSAMRGGAHPVGA